MRPMSAKKLEPTDEERGWLAIMRLNKMWPNREISKYWYVGPIRIHFLWRSKKNL